MRIRKLRLVYFSPTGTTKAILEGIAGGIGAEVSETLDITFPDAGLCDFRAMEADEMLLIGTPVYAGRIPRTAVERLRRLKAEGHPAVVVVLYGNRDMDDALLELSDLTAAAGFVPVAGGAFIGEHSFSSASIPLAEGRPDQTDIRKAREFGNAVGEFVRKVRSVRDISLPEFPGNRPYRDHHEFPGIAPVVDKNRCTACGICVAACPTGSISVDSMSGTDASTCILCCSCVKKCPESARDLKDPSIVKIVEWLHSNTAERREPALFPASSASEVS